MKEYMISLFTIHYDLIRNYSNTLHKNLNLFIRKTHKCKNLINEVPWQIIISFLKINFHYCLKILLTFTPSHVLELFYSQNNVITYLFAIDKGILKWGKDIFKDSLHSFNKVFGNKLVDNITHANWFEMYRSFLILSDE